MAYCRTSSDDWTSDVYVWSDGATWYTSVAWYRTDHDLSAVGDAPPEPADDASDAEWDEWSRLADERERAVLERVLAANRASLPHAGKTFTDPDRTACLGRLLGLREDGLHVPEFALERLRSETDGARAVRP